LAEACRNKETLFPFLSHVNMDVPCLPFFADPKSTTESSLWSGTNADKQQSHDMPFTSIRHPREGTLEARHSQQRLGTPPARAKMANQRVQAGCKLTYLAAAHTL